MRVGDFNGDGKLDIAVINGNIVSVLYGNGDGTFGTPVNYPQVLRHSTQRLEISTAMANLILQSHKVQVWPCC